MKTASAILMLALAGCATGGPLKSAAMADDPDWHAIATDDDQQRLRGWRDAWTGATDAVRAAGKGAALDADPALFGADQALGTPTPPPGDYRCRWIKLGSAAASVAAFTAYPAERCQISLVGNATRFRMLDGVQRPRGLIYSDQADRDVFLGTIQLGDETRPLDYARDEKRDMAGYVERIGAARWRLILPQPHFESMFDVIELVPAA